MVGDTLIHVSKQIQAKTDQEKERKKDEEDVHPKAGFVQKKIYFQISNSLLHFLVCFSCSLQLLMCIGYGMHFVVFIIEIFALTLITYQVYAYLAIHFGVLAERTTSI